MDKNVIDGKDWAFPEGDDFVDSHLIEKEFTENGVYDGPSEGDDIRGYSKVRVNVSSTPSVLVEKTITENGEYYAVNDEANGYSKVTVNVPVGVNLLSGETIPSSDVGSNGDIYIFGKEIVPTGLGWGAISNYIVEDANELLAVINSRNYYKTNNGKAIGVFLRASDYAGPVLVSSDPSYVYYSFNSSGTNYSKTIDGITMYMSTFNDWWSAGSSITNGVLKDLELDVDYRASSSSDYEGIMDAILEASAFTVSADPSGIVCKDIYYKDNGVWKTSGFVISEA